MAFTRRVRAPSPGGSRTQPSGTLTTLPSAARTVLAVGPGVKVWSSAVTVDLLVAQPFSFRRLVNFDVLSTSPNELKPVHCHAFHLHCPEEDPLRPHPQ